jgi:hypothetical protein
VMISACSNRGVYEGTQAWRVQDCETRSSRDEREQCRANARRTYPELEKSREEGLADR